MSEQIFSKCAAVELVKPIDIDEMYVTLYDYLDDTYGKYAFEIQFGNDFIAIYQNKSLNDDYGITRTDGLQPNLERLYRILKVMCNHYKIEVHNPPKHFTDFWYNGVDCSVTGMDWKDL